MVTIKLLDYIIHRPVIATEAYAYQLFVEVALIDAAREGDQQRRLSDREWLDLEEMLDSVTGGFVTRLRSRYPSLRDGDVRLCMLTRMGISNQVISDIYLITTSAVKHRKLKLKKDGFGVSDPECSLDEVIANI